MTLLLRVPDNGGYMTAAYVIVGVVLLVYSLRLMARTTREKRDG